jgi:hypothetical protein
LASLVADLEELEESVRIVEDVGGQFGLGEGEVRERRAFVGRLGKEVEVRSPIIPFQASCRGVADEVSSVVKSIRAMIRKSVRSRVLPLSTLRGLG